MGRTSEWFDKYELVDIAQIPETSPPIRLSWAKILYDMPTGKAGRIVTGDYETAKNLQASIGGSLRSARRNRRELDFKVWSKIIREDGDYVLYFGRKEVNNAHSQSELNS